MALVAKPTPAGAGGARHTGVTAGLGDRLGKGVAKPTPAGAGGPTGVTAGLGDRLGKGVAKPTPAGAGGTRHWLDCWAGRPPGEGRGNPPQGCCLENPTDR